MSLGTIVVILAVAAILVFAVGKMLKVDKPKVEPDIAQPNLPPDNPPITYAPGIIGGGSHVTIGDPITLDLRHRQAGCDVSGAYTLEYGAYDPEGKILNYFLSARGPSPDGRSTLDYGVFNNYGKRIDNRWIAPGSQATFAVDKAGPFSDTMEAVAQCKVFVGLDEIEPPYPMVAKGCAPESKDYVCPKCGYKANLATQMTPPCAKCGTAMEVYVATLGDVLGTMEFKYEVFDGNRSVAGPVLLFTVHKPCGTRAKKAKCAKP